MEHVPHSNGENLKMAFREKDGLTTKFLYEVLANALLGVNALLVVYVWGVLLLGSQRGFDITDEGYYLLNYSNYEDVITVTTTFFGAVVKPIYDLTGQQMVITRIIGMCSLLGVSILASVVTVSLLRSKRSFKRMAASNHVWQQRDNLNLILLSAGASALFYHRWIITPSYNWVVYVNILLFWIGLLLWIDWKRERRSRFGLALLGFSAALVFWGKATSAALLPLYVLVTLAVNSRHFRMLFSFDKLLYGVLGLIAGLIIPVLYGSSPSDILHSLTSGLEYASFLGLDQFRRGGMAVDFFYDVFTYIGVSIYYLLFQTLKWGPPLLIVFVMSKNWHKTRFNSQMGYLSTALVLSVGWAINLYEIVSRQAYITKDLGVFVLFLFYCGLIYLLMCQYAYHKIARTNTPPSETRLSAALWAVPLLFLILVYLAGTNISYTRQSAQFSIAIFLSFAVLLHIYSNPISRFFGLVFNTGMLILVVVITHNVALMPYRLYEPIWDMNTSVTIRNESETLLVGEETARYINELQSLAESGDFSPGTPLIDLTGHSPGAVYILEANVYGFAWNLGGEPGSYEATAYLLSTWDVHTLEQAWILTGEENAPNRIPEDVLSELGLDFPADYEKLGEVTRFHSSEVQSLWRPREAE